MHLHFNTRVNRKIYHFWSLVEGIIHLRFNIKEITEFTSQLSGINNNNSKQKIIKIQNKRYACVNNLKQHFQGTQPYTI